MAYKFKQIEEMLWFGFVSAGIAFLEVMVRWDPEVISNWETWAVALGGGLVRAFAGGVLANIVTGDDE